LGELLKLIDKHYPEKIGVYTGSEIDVCSRALQFKNSVKVRDVSRTVILCEIRGQ